MLEKELLLYNSLTFEWENEIPCSFSQLESAHPIWLFQGHRACTCKQQINKLFSTLFNNLS